MTRFFHGGPRGLRQILPPSVTGARSCASYGAEAARVCRRDFDEDTLFTARHYLDRMMEAVNG